VRAARRMRETTDQECIVVRAGACPSKRYLLGVCPPTTRGRGLLLWEKVSPLAPDEVARATNASSQRSTATKGNPRSFSYSEWRRRDGGCQRVLAPDLPSRAWRTRVPYEGRVISALAHPQVAPQPNRSAPHVRSKRRIPASRSNSLAILLARSFRKVLKPRFTLRSQIPSPSSSGIKWLRSASRLALLLRGTSLK